MSSYFHFLNDRKKTLKVEQPDLRMGESTKLMTGEWNKSPGPDIVRIDRLIALS